MDLTTQTRPQDADNRYHLENMLGKGGMGIVYRAIDRLSRQPVALKQVLLPDINGDANASEGMLFSIALAREFQTLASLRHPYIISVLDYGFDRERHPFFTMDLLEEPKTLYQAGYDQPLTKKIHLLVQVLQALVYLHRRGILHRDLKPDNTLVMQDGTVRLLDFGLAVLREQAATHFGGTLYYLAPEVIQGGVATEAADLYAVGVMAYELMVGRHPFTRPDSPEFELIRVLTHGPDMQPIYQITEQEKIRKTQEIPLSTSRSPLGDSNTLLHPPNVEPPIQGTTFLFDDDSTVDDVAPALADTNVSLEPITSDDDTLIVVEDDEFIVFEPIGDTTPPLVQTLQKLLEKDPAKRYRDAQQVIVDLSAAIGEPLPVETAATRESFLQAARFVGRQSELHVLTDALKRAIEGRGSVLFICGESGIGKSRLFDELRIRALVEGVLVVRGQATDSSLSYELWREPVRRLVLNTSLNETNASILKTIAPDMDELLGRPVLRAPELNPEEAQLRLVASLSYLFQRQPQPVVLLLEDLHWARSDSLAILNQIRQVIQGLPLLILANFRDDESPGLVEAFKGEVVLKLQRLNAAEIAELSESMLGLAARRQAVHDLLLRQTEGNVFFLVEVVRVLAEEAGQLDLIGSTPLPQTVVAGGIQEVVQRRLARVPTDYRPLLELAAVLGRNLDLKVIRAATADANTDKWLYACAQVAVLEVQDERWRFAHDKLRENVLSSLAPDTLRDLHRRAAVAIETTYSDRNLYAAPLAEHWKWAEDRTKELYYDQLAGEFACQTSAFVEAIIYFERGLELVRAEDSNEARVEQTRLLTQLANVYIQLGTYEEARRLLEDSLKITTGTGKDRTYADSLLNLGTIHFQEGNYGQAEELLERSLALNRMLGYEPGIADGLRVLAGVDDLRGNLEKAKDSLRESLALSREINDLWRIAKALNHLGIITTLQAAYDEAAPFLHESLTLFQRVGSRVGVAETLTNLGQLALFQELYDEATNHLQQSLSIYAEIGNRHALADTLNNLGYIALMQEKYEQAKTNLEESLVILQGMAVQWSIANTLTNLGHVLIAMGHEAEAEQRFRHALQQAAEIEAEPLLLEILAGLAKIHARAGNYAEALTLLLLAIHHPASDGNVRSVAEPLFEEIQTKLPSDQIRLMVEQSKTQSLITVVRDILKEG
jgi:eukaryotic-like serine/threonine-protein kinase